MWCGVECLSASDAMCCVPLVPMLQMSWESAWSHLNAQALTHAKDVIWVAYAVWRCLLRRNTQLHFTCAGDVDGRYLARVFRRNALAKIRCFCTLLLSASVTYCWSYPGSCWKNCCVSCSETCNSSQQPLAGSRNSPRDALL
jgi:hypothetical protein